MDSKTDDTTPARSALTQVPCLKCGQMLMWTDLFCESCWIELRSEHDALATLQEPELIARTASVRSLVLRLSE